LTAERRDAKAKETKPSREVPVATPARRLELLRQYSPVVYQIAGGFQRKLPPSVLREDLVAAGMGGLWDAIRRNGDRPGEAFEWYVRVRVRGAILDELRAQDWLPRRTRAAVTASNAQSPVPSVVRIEDIREWEQFRSMSELPSGEEAMDAKLASGSLAEAVERLPRRERHIVTSHYFGGVKFKDLGAELGVSEPRISQLHSRALSMLRSLIDAA
jgi:RNA polymerase sigma factor for flagellar operon FliA